MKTVDMMSEGELFTQYLCLQVLDAMLRDDVRGCVSRALVVSPSALPALLESYESVACGWLRLTHLDGGLVWIPVNHLRLAQGWRSAGLPLVCQDGDAVEELHDLDAIARRFARGLAPADTAAVFAAISQGAATTSWRPHADQPIADTVHPDIARKSAAKGPTWN